MVSIGGSDFWTSIETADPVEFRSLRVIPLLGPSHQQPEYRLFGTDTVEAVDITEVTEGGSIPDLRVKNKLKDRLLLIDGQELIGAKQNRILNTDVLIAAETEVVIPVSCVERGRWSYHSAKFSPGKMYFSSARAAKARAVHQSYSKFRKALVDQGEVWSEVDAMMARQGASSGTDALHDVYRQREEDLSELRSRLKLPPEAIGVAVYIGDRLLGLDLFDRTSTFSHYWPVLVESYGLDWLASDRAPKETGTAEVPLETLFEELATADWEAFDSPGEGRDLRLARDTVTASALLWEDGVVHLQAFPAPEKPIAAVDAIDRAGDDPIRGHFEQERDVPSPVAQREGELLNERCPRCGFLYGFVRSPQGPYCNHCSHEPHPGR